MRISNSHWVVWAKNIFAEKRVPHQFVLENSLEEKRRRKNMNIEISFFLTRYCCSTLMHLILNNLYISNLNFLSVKVQRKKRFVKQNSLKLLEREVTIMKNVKHINCVEFIECFVSKSFVFFVIEYCAGGDFLE